MKALIEDKLGIDLSGRPVTVTVRGVSRAADGRIHTDSKSKLVTLLVYMNREWESSHGRLRLLRSPDSLTDYLAEVPPDQGTLLLFKNGANVWHGFEPFEGQRRVIQVNWVTDETVVRRESSRHRFSAFMKRLFGNVHEFTLCPCELRRSETELAATPSIRRWPIHLRLSRPASCWTGLQAPGAWRFSILTA